MKFPVVPSFAQTNGKITDCTFTVRSSFLKLLCRTFACVFCLLRAQPLFTQNLVPNGTFEDPDTVCFISYYRDTTKSYFSHEPNKCIEPWGKYTSTQMLYHSQNYMPSGRIAATILLGDKHYHQDRSYVATYLKDTLQKGRTYIIEYEHRLWKSSLYTAKLPDILFDSSAISYNDYKMISAKPSIVFKEFESNQKWQIATAKYIANGTEVFMTMGNFQTPAKTKFKQIQTSEKQKEKKSTTRVFSLIDNLTIRCIDCAKTDKISTRFLDR